MSPDETFLDALIRALDRAAAFNPLQEAAPTAVLWPDVAVHWASLLPVLRIGRTVLSLGQRDREEDRGPAVWIRWRLADQWTESKNLGGVPPIVYLPDLSAVSIRDAPARSQRTGDDLALLADLRFRGAIWARSTGHDWTPRTFLSDSREGLGVEVRPGPEIDRALRRALPVLANLSLERLRADAPWRASDLDALAGFDPNPTGPTLTELIAQGEGQSLEFKQTARVAAGTGQKLKVLEGVIAKSVAAFLNTREGGTLLIGVRDDGTVAGIEADFAAWSKPQERDVDSYENWLMNGLLRPVLGADVMPLVRASFPVVGGKTVCRLDVRPGHRPVYVALKGEEPSLYVRVGNASPPLGVRDAVDYSLRRWGGSVGTPQDGSGSQ